MAKYTTKDIRNMALVGHAGAGKTTLTERLAHHAGVVDQPGSIQRGSTISDHDPLERKHHHSLSSSVLCFEHGGLALNIIDTPGYADFLGASFGAMPAVETVAVVINAAKGIEGNTRTLFEWLAENNQCRMIIINQIDQEGVDCAAIYAQIQETFGNECLAINLPANNSSKVVDCFFNPVGETDFSSVEEAHTAIIDQTIEVNDDLMTIYLEEGEVAPVQLHDSFEQALREGHLIPVCFTSCETGAGIHELLDVVEKLLPNPTEGNPPVFENGVGEDAVEVEVIADVERHSLAHVFKVTFDPFVGRIAYARLHQGSITKDAQLFIGDARKPVKLNNLYKPLGKTLNESDTLVAGDIFAVTKVEGLGYDSVLHDSHEEDYIHLKPIMVPAPMVGLAISAAKRGDEQKVMDALHKIVEEDPCLKLERDPTANETVLRGLGELHLRTVIERLETQYKVEVETSTPTVPYRETITKQADGHCRHKKQTGGAGQFGEVFLKVRPLNNGGGFEFVNKIVGGVIPSQFIPAVEKGVRQVLDAGALAGFPVQDVEVTVVDGKHHAVDSKEVAFVAAGKKAFIDALSKAGPVVLEPVMDLAVTAPSENMGDITGDLSSRRGRVSSTDSLSAEVIRVSAQVPLAELDDYQSRLKSMTGGEGSFVMEFFSYEQAPRDVQQRLADAYQHPEED